MELTIHKEFKFENFKDMVFEKIEISDDKRDIVFETRDGRRFLMLHEQDCCEDVYLEDVAGNIDDLIGFTIVLAEEVIERSPGLDARSFCGDSETWTFYKFRTNAGDVTLRWVGSSNGYYSESVSLYEVCKPINLLK